MLSPATNETNCLDTLQLSQLEQSFREWAERSQRSDISLSRKRIFLILLLIRYTCARLNEVLTLNPFQDIDPIRQVVCFGKTGAEKGHKIREVQMSEALSMIQNNMLLPVVQRMLGHSVITRESGERIGLQKGDPIRVLFNCFSVVLHRDLN
jgi:hypothetical protein